MIAPDLSMRYTAVEALQVMECLYNDLNAPRLAERHIRRRVCVFTWQAYDRWAGLLEDFVARCVPQLCHRSTRKPKHPVFLEIDSDY